MNIATTETTGTALALIEGSIPIVPAKLFEPDSDQLDQLIDKIEAEVMAEHCDVETAMGRERERHLAALVVRSKTTLDGMGKALTDEHRKIVGMIDARRRHARERLDGIAKQRRADLTAWEAKEKQRQEHVAEVIDWLKRCAQPPMGTSLEMLHSLREQVRNAEIAEEVFASEFERAMQIRAHADTQLSTLIDAEERRIEDQRRQQEEMRRLAEERRREEEAAAEQRRKAEAEIAEQRRQAAEEARQAREEREQTEREMAKMREEMERMRRKAEAEAQPAADKHVRAALGGDPVPQETIGQAKAARAPEPVGPVRISYSVRVIEDGGERRKSFETEREAAAFLHRQHTAHPGSLRGWERLEVHPLPLPSFTREV